MIPFPAIDPIAFSIPLPYLGELPIRWYGLAYIAGFVCGYGYFKWALKKYPLPGFTPKHLEELFVWVILSVIIGGRLGFVLFYNPGHYLDNPQDILKTWEGGMSFHGGFLGVVIALILFSFKHKLNPIDLGDRLAPAYAWVFSRYVLQIFINGELWGRPTDVPWAMIFPAADNLPRHPSQLYEAALEGLVLFIILHILLQTRFRRFLTTGAFMAGYGIFRFLVEYVREPDPFMPHTNPMYYYITQGQILSIPMIIVGTALIIFSLRKYGKSAS